MNKEDLIEKGLMPKKVDWCWLYENGFKYIINGKTTLKLFDGTVLIDDEEVNYCYLYNNGFNFIINNKTTLKLFDGTVLIDNKNIFDCHLYKNGFKYEINNKYTLKLFDGTTLCENVDDCYLFDNGFEYKNDNKIFEKDLKEFTNKKKDNMKKYLIKYKNVFDKVRNYKIVETDDYLKLSEDIEDGKYNTNDWKAELAMSNDELELVMLAEKNN